MGLYINFDMGRGTGRGADEGLFTVVGGCCCLMLIVSSILLGCSFDTLSPTEVGLDYDGTTLNVDYGTLYSNGRYFLGIGHKFISSLHLSRQLSSQMALKMRALCRVQAQK